MCSLINDILPTREVLTLFQSQYNWVFNYFYHFKKSIIGYHFLDFIFFSGMTVNIALFLFSYVSQVLNFIPFLSAVYLSIFLFVSA